MANVRDIYEFLDRVAPIGLKAGKDNVGFLLGRGGSDVSKIIVSLDITNDVISEAIDERAGLIVSHHPLFFALNAITDSDSTGAKLLLLAENGIAAVCMHTNLDAAAGGVNDVLARTVGIENPQALAEDGKAAEDGFSCGRYGYLKSPAAICEYLILLKSVLNARGLRYHDAGRNVYKVAVVGGSGGGEFKNALEKECDTFISADIKYHLFLEAKELGVNLIDGDHFCTENVIIEPIAGKLRKAFPEINVMVSKTHEQTVRFL